MRLGGPVFETYHNPQEWVAALKRLGYRAAYCPVGLEASLDVVHAYASAAEQADIAIAEVGVWNNPLNHHEPERQAALQKNQALLALADEIGARCCVNISGSRGEKWDGPHADNLTPETFEMIVETVRKIIDAVNPKRSFYTLESMPWMYPDTIDCYLDLIHAIDRPQFAAHLDPVNMINCPQHYFHNADLIRECAARLGPWIKSVHIKDTLIAPDKYTLHIDEMPPGLGTLDYLTLLTEFERLNPDLPIMLEHLPDANEYALAAGYVRSKAKEAGVTL